MLLSDGNLREVNFVIRAHGERWNDDSYYFKSTHLTESRLFFILKGRMYYEFNGTSGYAAQGQSFAHFHYCNFVAVLHNECLFNHMEGDWICTVPDPEATEKLFSRFHTTNVDNLILDCIEKRYCLVSLLLEMVRNSNLRTIDYESHSGFLLNGIALYIKRKAEEQKKISIDELAGMANMHPHYFISKFKSQFGKTPLQYALDCKLEKAAEYLSDRNLTINEISGSEILLQVHPAPYRDDSERVPEIPVRRQKRYSRMTRALSPKKEGRNPCRRLRRQGFRSSFLMIFLCPDFYSKK